MSELCNKAQIGLPVLVACLLLLGDFEDMTRALLGRWARPGGWGVAMNLCLPAEATSPQMRRGNPGGSRYRRGVL